MKNSICSNIAPEKNYTCFDDRCRTRQHSLIKRDSSNWGPFSPPHTICRSPGGMGAFLQVVFSSVPCTGFRRAFAEAILSHRPGELPQPPGLPVPDRCQRESLFRQNGEVPDKLEAKGELKIRSGGENHWAG